LQAMEANHASHDDPNFIVSDQRPERAETRRNAPEDPPFAVSDRRPEIVLNRRGFVVGVGTRSKSALTDAVLNTLRGGGSVEVPFDDDSHTRLFNRFTSLQQRLKVQRIVFRHSFVFEGDKQDPVKVQWWCEQLTPDEKRAEEERAEVAAEQRSEPVVGRDVE
jgi:hypothetical protein